MAGVSMVTCIADFPTKLTSVICCPCLHCQGNMKLSARLRRLLFSRGWWPWPIHNHVLCPTPPPAVTAPAPWLQPWPEPQLTASCRPTSPSTTSIRLQKTELTRYHVSPQGSYGASLTLTQIRSLTHTHHPTHTCRRVTTRDLTQFLRLKKTV